MKNALLNWLRLPDYEGAYDIDDPRITELRRDIILGKPFLKKLYVEWYNAFKQKMQDAPAGKTVEIGSGGGFIKDIMPEVITSDIMPLSYTDMTFGGEDMPFADNELNGILMIDVLHHIPKPAEFFNEASRALKPGGKIIMTEPANSSWGRFIYTRFHHEPFEPEGGWEIPATGPLSGANGALPWIIFERDRDRFEKEFPQLEVRSIRYHTPLRYLLSGGVSLRPLVPNWSFGLLKTLETINPFKRAFSMFHTIELVKR